MQAAAFRSLLRESAREKSLYVFFSSQKGWQSLLWVLLCLVLPTQCVESISARTGTGWLSGGDLSERRAPPCWPHSGTAAGTVPRSFRPSSSMVLRGGAVEEADVEDRKYQEREAMWQKNLKEWEWILGHVPSNCWLWNLLQIPFPSRQVQSHKFVHTATSLVMPVKLFPAAFLAVVGFRVSFD
eukprot:1678030-Rhodomonas_salina.4